MFTKTKAVYCYNINIALNCLVYVCYYMFTYLLVFSLLSLSKFLYKSLNIIFTHYKYKYNNRISTPSYLADLSVDDTNKSFVNA